MRVSVDVGYGFVKAVGQPGRRIIVPSTVGPARTARGLGAAFGDGHHRDGHDVTISISGTETRYTIGSASGQRSWATDAAQRSGYLPLALTAAALAGGEDNVEILAGLPLALWLQAEQRRELRASLRGVEATVTIDARRPRQVHVTAVQVLPQGAGAFAAAMRDDQTLAERPVGLVDVGYRTVDYLAMRRTAGAVVPDEAACGSIDLGAGRVFENVRQALSDQTGTMLPAGAVEDALQNYDARLTIRGRDHDVAALVDAEAEALATAIGEQIHRAWSDRLDLMGAVLLAGGGGELLHRHLRRLHPKVKLLERALYANAEGYLVMAG